MPPQLALTDGKPEASNGEPDSVKESGEAVPPCVPANLAAPPAKGPSGKGKGSVPAKKQPEPRQLASKRPARDEEPDFENDFKADVPPPVKLSEGAIDRRLRRIMAVKTDGSLKVPEEVVKQWKDLDTRHEVLSAFEKAGYKPDR